MPVTLAKLARTVTALGVCATALLALSAVTNTAAAAEKKNFKVAWSIYVGWMPWDYAN